MAHFFHLFGKEMEDQMNFKHILTLIEEHYKEIKCSYYCKNQTSSVSSMIDQSIIYLKKNNLKKSLNSILSAYELIISKNQNSNEIFTILALITLIHNVNDASKECN